MQLKDIENRFVDEIDEDWLYARIKIGIELKRNNFNNNKRDEAKKEQYKFTRLLYKALKITFTNLVSCFDFRLFKKNYKLVVLTDSSQEKLFGGKYRDRLVSPVVKCLSLEESLALVRSNPERNIDLQSTGCDVQLDDFKVFFWVRLFALFRFRHYPKIKNLLDENNLDFLYPTVQRYVNYCYVQKSVFSFLFSVWGTKTLLTTCHYVYQGVISAAKQKNIDVIEVQHGVITKEHFGFYSPVAKGLSLYPNKLLSFGEIDQGNGFLIGQVHEVGSYYIDYFINHPASVEIEGDWSSVIGCSFQLAEWEESAFCEYILHAAAKLTNVLFLVIPRNIEQANRLSKVITLPNILVEKEHNFYEIIKSCDLHCTLYSSCALEAPVLGIPNILINVKGYARAYYDDMLPDIYTLYVENIPEFEVAIIEMSNSKFSQKEIRKAHSKIVKPNYLENLEALVRADYDS